MSCRLCGGSGSTYLGPPGARSGGITCPRCAGTGSGDDGGGTGWTGRIVIGVVALLAMGALPHACSSLPPAAQPSAPQQQSVESSTRPGWHVVNDTTAGITYELPPGWTTTAFTPVTITGGSVSNTGSFGTYSCDDHTYERGEVASAHLDNATADMGRSASNVLVNTAIAWWSAPSAGAGGPSVSTPAVVNGAMAGGVTSARADAEVTVTPTTTCLSSRARVAALTVSNGTRAAVVCIGLDDDPASGGSAGPPLPDRNQIDAIFATVRMTA